MKVAIVGSRTATAINIAEHLPEGTSEIISGGAAGVDSLAEAFAHEKGLKLTVIRPDYNRFGRRAPHVRNREIVMQADVVLAFWDGTSRGTASSINQARQLGRAVKIIKI